MRKPLLAFLLGLLATTSARAQPTVGLLQHSPGSTDDGYVLLAPIAYPATYLLDKCGR